MPALHSANISSKLLAEFGGGQLIGPMLNGLDKTAQIVPMGASISQIFHIAYQNKTVTWFTYQPK